MATKTETAQRELVITRTFDAPRELVFKAWTEPEHVLHWLGPKDFTGLEFRFDDKPGGTWLSRMRGPDGKELANGGRVLEYVEPERLSFTFKWDDGGQEETTIEITLVERDGKTEMTFRQGLFETTESRDGHNGGWSESFDKLAGYLAKA
jgi:uncharacterized protein YndB with AHSA1/START domain